LLADHRLALGDGPRAGRAADVEDGRARLLGGRAPVHMAAIPDHFALELLEIEIEMRQRVVLDVARGIAQRFEFRQFSSGLGAPLDEIAPDMAECALQLRILERRFRMLGEPVAGRLHHATPFRRCVSRAGSPIAGASPIPASSSATWKQRTGEPSRLSLPAILRRQPRSHEASVPAPVSITSAALRVTMPSEIAGYLTQNVPPNPQQACGSASATDVRPRTARISCRGATTAFI